MDDSRKHRLRTLLNSEAGKVLIEELLHHFDPEPKRDRTTGNIEVMETVCKGYAYYELKKFLMNMKGRN